MADNSPSILVRAVWFIFVGWWLTGIWLSVAWLLNLTIVGIPLGIKMINKAPYVLSLKHLSNTSDVDEVEVGRSSGKSPNLVIRAIYFVFIGWWASGLLMMFAYLISLTIVGLPFAIMLFNYLPYVVSLKRH